MFIRRTSPGFATVRATSCLESDIGRATFYINPDMQYDKGNEWVELFNNIFVK